MKYTPKFNLKKAEEDLSQFGYGQINIPINQESLECLYRISLESNLRDSKIVERVLNLPEERRERLTDLLVKNKGIDVELASNLNLTNEQYGAHRDIAQHNYNVEYGHLKDSGYDSVDKSLISNPDLSLDQLSLIHVATTNNHTYNPQQFLDENNQVLPTHEILDVMSEQRINANEVKQALKEVNRDIETLSRDELKTLNELHMNGKTDPEQSKQFYSTLNPINQVSEAELEDGAEQIASRNTEFTPDELAAIADYYEEQRQLESQSENDSRLENSDNQVGVLYSSDNNYDLTTTQLAKKLENDYNTKFTEVYNEETRQSYYQSNDGSIDITDEGINVNTLTPEAVELAIAATVAKFGNNIIIDGTDEFKAQVLDQITQNPKFADIKILNPELQDQIADSKLNHQKSLDNQVESLATEQTIYIDNNSELMQAISDNSSIDKVEELIKNGANLEHKNTFGETALTFAIENNNHPMTKLLIDKGANVEYKINNISEFTPLHKAATFAMPEIAHILIENGANPNSLNAFGRTPEQQAVFSSNYSTADLLKPEQNIDLIIPKDKLIENQAEKYQSREEALTSDKHYMANVNGEYLAFDNRDELLSAVLEERDQDYKMEQDLADSYYEDGLDEFAEKLAEREEIEKFEIEEVEHVREQEQEHERD